ncbi:MAG: carbamate kinase [Deltaproteobacteria bacterium]|nr:carbamate kinase [Deltaproteobacteria bacterium]
MEDLYLKRVVVALGGNAILQFNEKGTVGDQIANLRRTSAQLAPIIASWYQVVITHGNGPQVGNILIQNERAKHEVPPMPLDVCGAESQGQIGYLLNQALSSELKRMGKSTEVCTLMSQVVVDPEDEAFDNPSKPIGPWLSLEGMNRSRREGETWIEHPGRGWRKVVASPKPVRILNARTIESLLSNGFTVIACGGGGVPVIEDAQGDLRGIEAVIDKDLASACMAAEIKAHILLILTDVSTVFLNFGTSEQKPIRQIEVSELRRLFEKGQFPAGSIGPKVEAALQFVERGGERALIARLDEAEAALKGKTGTTVTA